ncbi:MAG: DNA repair protein RecN [Firmicutes bacterium]|nr:DNA repair protein RecN [Bacillota bacterium]
MKKLTIKNVALISEMDIEFEKNLNILSGETGAGKSIIVDSLFLLLGAKYDKSLLSHGQEFGLVEGVFEVGQNTQKVLDEFLIESEGDLIVTRRFDQEGKNTIRINGRSANIAMLRDITNTLVDIYGQNQHLTLLESSSQLRLVEFFDKKGIAKSLEQVSGVYAGYKETKKQLNSLGSESERQREIETLTSQIAEIEDAAVVDNEEENLIAKRKVLLSSERVSVALQSVVETMAEQEGSVLQLLGVCKNALAHIKDVQEFETLATRVESVKWEIKDIADTASDAIASFEGQGNDIDGIEKRLELVRKIKRKYGAGKVLAEYLQRAKERLDLLCDADAVASKFEKKLATQRAELYKTCEELSELRRVAAGKLEKAMIQELDELGMQGAKFEVRFADKPTLQEMDKRVGANGFDGVEYYLSTNKGQPIKPLAKVISGGEMSRFMLAIKVIMSQIESIDTLIFDEIDTGISGVIGQAVAKKLAKISRHKQVLCVSHLSQIVAMADKNYLIAKSENKNQKTTTSIVPISGKQKTKEVARLSGGMSSDTALRAANELEQWSIEYKKALVK